MAFAKLVSCLRYPGAMGHIVGGLEDRGTADAIPKLRRAAIEAFWRHVEHMRSGAAPRTLFLFGWVPPGI